MPDVAARDAADDLAEDEAAGERVVREASTRHAERLRVAEDAREAARDPSRSPTSTRASRHAGIPARCVRIWRMVTSSLPFLPNSGKYSTTASSRWSRRCSSSRWMTIAVTAFEAEKKLKRRVMTDWHPRPVCADRPASSRGGARWRDRARPGRAGARTVRSPGGAASRRGSRPTPRWPRRRPRSSPPARGSTSRSLRLVTSSGGNARTCIAGSFTSRRALSRGAGT